MHQQFPKGMVNAEAGAGDGGGDEAGLVAELGAGCGGGELHRLDGVHGDLRRELLGLLVGDGLAVDIQGTLRVIAQGMEETVRIGHDAGTRERDHVGHSGSGGERGIFWNRD